MKTKLGGLVAGLCAFVALGGESVEKHTGDWQGTVTIDGSRQPMAVYMIPRGAGRYEARLVADFLKRGPYLHRLQGGFYGGQFKFIDDTAYDAKAVIDTTGQGVVFAASLWSGALSDSMVQGQIAGKQNGTFELKKTCRMSPALGAPAPEGAVMLSNLQSWRARNAGQAIKWKVLPDGIFEVAGGGDIVCNEKANDQQLHLEFRLPCMPEASGQGRANSGAYLQGRYEVQVLDSYGLEGADNECGGIYQVARPLVNMCAPPLQWQTYDITFHAAKLGADGKKIANARVTVVHNGVTIHENLELPHATPGGVDEREGTAEGLMLQDHGNPVQFRNIWLKRLN